MSIIDEIKNKFGNNFDNEQEIIEFIRSTYLDKGLQEDRLFSTDEPMPLIMWAVRNGLNIVVKFLGDEFKEHEKRLVDERCQQLDPEAVDDIDDAVDDIKDEVYTEISGFLDFGDYEAVSEPFNGNVASLAFLQKNTEIVRYLYEQFNLLPVDENEYADARPNHFIKKIFKPVGCIQAGYIVTGDAIPRPPRKMSVEDEERQLLKRISTMLYFNLQAQLGTKAKNVCMKEIECMHVTMAIDGSEKHFLFIAANETKAAGYLSQVY